jgi:hypothetical protein
MIFVLEQDTIEDIIAIDAINNTVDLNFMII